MQHPCNHKYLVILLPGYTVKIKNYDSIKKVIKESYPGATISIPPIDMSKFSVADPNDLVMEVIKLIDAEWKKEVEQNNGEEKSVKLVLIGHSTGAVLVRKLYVVACGENKDAPFENSLKTETANPRPWTRCIDRIILFAGVNRGWTLNHHLYTKTAMLIWIGIFVNHFFRLFGHKLLIFKTRRGAPFITQLRIQWLSMLRNASSKNIGNTLVIQLLGTIDDLISPEDNVDMVTGHNFIYLEVPLSDHMSVLKMDDGEAGENRRAVFEKALITSPEDLYGMQVLPVDQSGITVDEDVTDVVFVIHGIRDTGYWTQKVARRVKAIGDLTGRKFATETSTYGYFPILHFLLPYVRRKKVEWLMDQYTENLAQYPKARFSFMGHSNGTYLLAKALKEYPACSFKHVVFAGSVVHSKFNWQEMISKGRICKFYNFVASSDWVVAMFPKSFQILRLQDLGSGGFDGFTSKLEEPYQVKFVKGAHGAATEEKYWDEIANFIVDGKFKNPIDELATPQRSRFMRFLGAIAPVPFLIIVGFVLALGWAIVFFTPDYSVKIVFLCIYLFLVYKVTTWF